MHKIPLSSLLQLHKDYENLTQNGISKAMKLKPLTIDENVATRQTFNLFWFGNYHDNGKYRQNLI